MNLSSLSLGLTKTAGSGSRLITEVAAILRKYGTDAHVYLPGIGVINGLTAGNYLDSAGTTAATVDNPVGLVIEANATLGSELVVNGGFDSDTAWTKGTNWSISGGFGVGTAVPTGQNLIATNYITTVVGQWYEASWTVSTIIAGQLQLLIFNGAGNYAGNQNVSTAGTYKFRFQATATIAKIYVSAYVSAFTGTVDDFSIKSLSGFPAVQGTTANKPILRRGAVNLLTYSEQFDNAAWWKGDINVSPNSTTDPLGGNTADTLTPTTTGGVAHYFLQPVSATGLVTRTVYAKANGYNVVFMTLNNSGSLSAWFNLSTMQVSQIGASVTATAITDEGNGWRKLSLTATASVGFVQDYVAPNASSAAYAGDGTSGIYIWGAQLQTGSVATDYIPTTTAPASSSTGNYWWQFDSTDLLTATFPAGYESATIINTAETGQVTYTGQNIVGAYGIGGAVIGSELVTNGTFDSNINGWDVYGSLPFDTFEWSSGRLRVVTDGSTRCLGGQSSASAFPVTLGKVYKIKITVQVTSGSCGVFRLSQTYHGTPVDGGVPLLLVSGVGTYEVTKYIYVSASVNAHITFESPSGTAGEYFIDNVSVKEATPKEYAHFIFRTGLTASELTTMQTFANRLAGV